MDIESIENYPNNRSWQARKAYCLIFLLMVELGVGITSPFLQNLFPWISAEIVQGIRPVELSVGFITLDPLFTLVFGGFLSKKRNLDRLRSFGKVTRRPGISVAIVGAVLALLVFLLGYDQAAYYFLIIVVDLPLTFVFGVLVLTWFVTPPREVEEGEAEWEEGKAMMEKRFGYLTSTKAKFSRPQLIGVTWRDNLEQAITHFYGALQHFTRDRYPYEYALVQCDLGKALELRIDSSRRDNLKQAITCFSEALQVFKQTHYLEEYAIIAKNLGIIYIAYMEDSRSDNLEKAIAYFQESIQALQVCDLASSTKKLTRFSRMYTEVLNNLGNAYRESIEGDRSDNLEKAIACHREALQLPNPDYARIQHDLGLAYRERLAGDRRDNLEKAIECFKAAMQVYSFGHDTFYEQAMTLRSLGTVYQVRIEGNRCENLEKALVYYKEALKIHTLEDFPIDSRDAQLCLADALITLIEECRNPKAARDRYSQAHEAYAAAQMAQAELGWLESDEQGRALLQGSNKLTREMYARDAWCLVQLSELQHAVVALEAGRAQALAEAQAIAGAPLDGVCVQHVDAFVSARRDSRVARINGDLPRRRAARDAFLQVRQDIRNTCQPNFLPAAPTYQDVIGAAAPDQAIVYLTATDKGGLSLAVTLSRSGKPQIQPCALPRFTKKNIDALLWTTANPSDEPTFLEVDRPVGGYMLAQAKSGFRCLRQWGESVSDAIMHLPPASGLAHAARQLVQNWADFPALLALLDMPFADLSDEDLTTLARKFNLTLLDVELKQSLHTLGELGISQLAIWLKDQSISKVAIVPYGPLGLFPLPAVGINITNDGVYKEQTLGDLFEVTIAPSAHSLEIARRHALEADVKHEQMLLEITAASGGHSLVGAKQSEETVDAKRQQILAVSNVHLEFAKAEAEYTKELAELFSVGPVCFLTGSNVTRESVKKGLEHTWLAHLAVHGQYNEESPHQSRLILADGERVSDPGHTITLDECLSGQVNLPGTRLLVLSACETSIIDVRRAANEVIGMASGFLQAGAAGVIASLWAVDDLPTYLLISRFMLLYLDPAHKFWSPAQCLAKAQQWLREEATNEILSTYDPIMEVSVSTNTPNRQVSPNTGLSEVHRISVRRAKAAPQTCPYVDPFYWAAFTVVGC